MGICPARVTTAASTLLKPSATRNAVKPKNEGLVPASETNVKMPLKERPEVA